METTKKKMVGSTDQGPEPGIYPSTPFDVYASWPHVNNSLLCEAILDDSTISMAHMKSAMDGHVDYHTDAMRIGKMMHMRLLEPELYFEEVMVSTTCVKTKKSGEVCTNDGYLYSPENKTWHCNVQSHAPGDAFEPEDYLKTGEAEAMEQMVIDLGKHQAVKLFKAHGGVEVSFVWDQKVEYEVASCEPCGLYLWPDILKGANIKCWQCGGNAKTVKRKKTVRCKGRADKDLPKPTGIPPVFIDLKGCRRGYHTDYLFGKAISNNHYDSQGAFYRDGLEQIDGVKREMCWIAIEKSHPFDINPIWCDEATYEFGRQQYQHLLRCFCISIDADDWPGIARDVHKGGLTAYMKRQAQFSWSAATEDSPI